MVLKKITSYFPRNTISAFPKKGLAYSTLYNPLKDLEGFQIDIFRKD